MSLFQDHILKPLELNQNKEYPGIPIPLNKLSKVTNYIEKTQNIIIGGRPNSGKKSFMDYIYFIQVYKWWQEQPENIRPKIKFFYFNMRKNLRVKLQKWLCLYLKLEYNIIIDIPTLNNSVGKLYDIDEETRAQIISAKEFFNELEEGPLTLINGRKTPSEIFNIVEDYMLEIGRVNDHGTYYLDDKHVGQYTIILVDDINCLLSETDGFSLMDTDRLKRKFAEYIDKLKNIYNTTNILIVPNKSTYSRSFKDTEPSYKELGIYNDIADVGIIAYNPFNENHLKYNGYPIESLMIRGKNRFRTVTIVTNKEGLENQTLGLFFIGECGYIAEAPHPTERELFEERIEILRELH